MDKVESTRLETYLRKTLGSAGLGVTTRGKEEADLMLAGMKVGDLSKDEDEGELSYYLSVGVEPDAASPISWKNATLEAPERARCEKLLKERLNAPTLSVRPRPRKTDSAEVYIGEEFIGTLSKDEQDGKPGFYLTMSILDIDLEDDA